MKYLAFIPYFSDNFLADTVRLPQNIIHIHYIIICVYMFRQGGGYFTIYVCMFRQGGGYFTIYVCMFRQGGEGILLYVYI